MSKNSGPAFPQHYGDKPTGMSRRDYFASLAMAAYLTSPATAQDATNDAARCSEWAYIQADAMIEESAK